MVGDVVPALGDDAVPVDEEHPGFVAATAVRAVREDPLGRGSGHHGFLVVVPDLQVHEVDAIGVALAELFDRFGDRAAEPADAVGAGTTTNVSTTLITSAGSALAEGVTALLSTAVTVTCNAADAMASGTSAYVNRAVNCATIAAAAEGVTASLVVGGIDVTITTSYGDAVADGVAADVITMVTLVTTPANAVAEGVASSVSGPSYVTCSTANAVASGTVCLVTVNVPFEAEVVNLRSALTKRVSLRSAL